MLRFTDELIARVARAGAGGTKLLRADSGFWSTRRSVASTDRHRPDRRKDPGRAAPDRLAHFAPGQVQRQSRLDGGRLPGHNLLYWTSLLGRSDDTIRAARTTRRRLLALLDG